MPLSFCPPSIAADPTALFVQYLALRQVLIPKKGVLLETGRVLVNEVSDDIV